MRAALLNAPNTPIEIVDDVEIADPGFGQVRVDVQHCGLCHSDLSQMKGVHPGPLPIVLGHEAAGVVSELGPGVGRLSVGDRVLLTPSPSCGHCYWCLRDQASLCVESTSGVISSTFLDGTTGLSRQGELVYRGVNVGGFAAHALMLEAGCVRVPDEVDLAAVAVLGCAVQTGVGSVFNVTKVEPGSTVLVMGLGGIGISVVQGARIAGASRIVVSDPVAARRDQAEHFGATHAIDPSSEDLVAACMALTGSIGVDYAFECVGNGNLLDAGYYATRNGGTMCVIGAGPLDHTLSVPSPVLAVSQKTIVGSMLGGVNSQRDVPMLIDLYQAGKLDLEAMVTQRRPIEELQQAADDMTSGLGVRTLLDL